MTFPTRQQMQLKWWNIDPKEEIDIARALVMYAQYLEGTETNKRRQDDAEMYSCLYTGASIFGRRPWQFIPLSNMTSRLKYNIVAACIDTAMNRIAGQRPAPKFVTNGADFDMRRKAPKLNKFGKGMLYQSKTYALGPKIFRDACIFGTGIARIVGDKKTKLIRTERVLPWNILVEDTDAYYGEPRTMVQKNFVDKFVLADTWPQFKDQIMESRGKDLQYGDVDPTDQLVVWESWHLPSGPGAKDGRHVIAIDNCLLFQEEWTRPNFPFAIIRWQDPIGGFWGQGIAGALVSCQFEINELLRRIQESMKLMGVTKILMSSGGGTPKTHINNDIGAIITYNAGSSPPTVVAPMSVHPELYQQVERLVARAYAEIGLSELSAESRKPVGLDSGKALREYNDIESERFIIVGRAYEDWFMNVVACALDEAREIPGFSVDVPDKNELVRLDWKDVDLERDAYTVQCFPESILPQTPAGRTQTIEEWQRAGIVSKEQSMELLAIPDLEEATSLATAGLRATRKRVEQMLDTDDEYQSPEPYDDLKGALQYVNAVYLDEREKGCPEDKLELLRRYMNEIIALMTPPAPPAPTPSPQPQQTATQAPSGGPVQPLTPSGPSGPPVITDPGQMVS